MKRETVERRRIVLLGATGYTGQRVLRELLARGEEPTLVGRNHTSGAIHAARSGDGDRGGTGGGAHYFDSTGEGTFVRRVFELDSVATARGATVVPAFGYDYVPGNLAGALALTSAGDRATRMEIGYFLTRAGHGDALRYRSGLRDVFSLTTGARGRPWSVRRPMMRSPIATRTPGLPPAWSTSASASVCAPSATRA